MAMRQTLRKLLKNITPAIVRIQLIIISYFSFSRTYIYDKD